MNRMNAAIAACLCVAALGSYEDEVAAAKKDYASRYAAGENPRYLDLGKLPREVQPQAAIAIKFFTPHLSLGAVLEHQIPENLAGTSLWRIDLDLVGWKRKAWIELAKEYPYTPGTPAYWEDPLIIRADWFLAITSDASDSQAYYTLLYAQVGTPKNKADWLKIHRVDSANGPPNPKDDNRRTAVILDKGRSGVAFETRLMAEVDDGDHWETFDSANATFEKDPLEQLEGDLKFDAQEFIKRIRKVHLKSGERTFVQAYLLANGQGKRQDEAPTDIVLDKNHFRGQPSIRTPGSCIGCHAPLNGPAHNAVRDRIRSGREIKTNDQVFFEQTYLAKQQKLVDRATEDFEIFTQLACGCEPAEAVECFNNVIGFYDANVSLGQAAREVCAKDAAELQRALAYYSEKVGPQDDFSRFSDLAHEFDMPRKAWEGDIKRKKPGAYHYALKAMEEWRKR